MTFRKNASLVFWLLAVIFMISLAGCGSNSPDEVAPSLTFNGIGNAVTTTPTRTLSGTTDPGATISITINDVAVAAADITVLATGEWSSTVTLLPGTNLVTVAAADATGNQALFALSLTYDAISIESYTTPIPTASLTVGGLVDSANYTAPLEVTVTPADTAVAPFTVTATVVGDIWSADLTGLATGANEVKLSNAVAGVATSPVEIMTTITVDASAPLVSIDQPTTKVVVPSQTLTGGSDLAATSVTVSPSPVGGTPTIDAGTGDWSAAIEGLAIGKTHVTVTAIAGTTSVAHALLIVEQQPPLVTKVSPAENALDVDVNAVISVVFQVDMDAATIDGNFSLMDGVTPVSATVAYDTTTRTATLTPNAPLSSATIYTVDLTTAVTDANSNNLAQPLSWNFTTL